jgi:hypothetical protein
MNLNLDEFRYKMFWSNSHTGEHLATAIKAITTD